MPADPPADETPPAASHLRRILVLGATGSIGRANVQALIARGHAVRCLVRAGRKPGALEAMLPGAEIRIGDVTDPADVSRLCFGDGEVSAVVSCLASRTGAPKDAWAIDHAAHRGVLAAARAAGVAQMVLLSAICVQKPRLAFQQAKLAFEAELMQSGLDWSIVRPTAYFKSLCGQLDRLRAGKPFLVFGDGRLTACKPISDRDLADFIAGCLDDPARRNRILPIGGPGPALTPLEIGTQLSRALGREPAFRHVPVALLDTIIVGLSAAGVVSQRLREKAELARIGRYYATESMLLWDAAAGRYNAAATPEHGSETLFEFQRKLVAGDPAALAEAARDAHAVF
ncbi:MAG: NAD(P)H-binding protein [Pseudomonadota bacterium]